MAKITISKQNTKLGKIPSFSLPTISTCPGATSWCSKACYAAKVERIYKNAKKSYEENYKATEEASFVDQMDIVIKKLLAKNILTMRLHVSGDIFSIKYVYDLIKIAKNNPTMKFYSYTRSWRLSNFLPHLEILRSQPNVELFASLDDEILALKILPPNTWRVSYVGLHDINMFSSLVSRQTIICPNQVHKKMLCDTCKFCFNDKLKTTTRSVYFIQH